MSITYTTHTLLHRALGNLRWLPTSAVALTVFACAGNVEVGEAKPDAEETGEDHQASGDDKESNDDGIDEPVPTAEEPRETSGEPEEVDCSEADTQARAPYEAWQELDNDFGVLAGKTFKGYIEAGPDLLLTIEADHTATLVVGEAAPAPVKDQGYLCDESFEDEFTGCEIAASHPPVTGGSYPLHGATLDDGRLKAPIQQQAAWDAWCALQDSYEQVQPDRCFFTTSNGAGFSVSPLGCKLDEEPVDCGWLALSMSGVCSCTSTECFAAIAGEGELLDARLNDTQDQLVGSFRGATVYLFLEEAQEEEENEEE